MTQYILKSALVAEIERLISNGQVKLQESQESNDYESNVVWSERIATCRKVLSFINTLEVKEVDLEKELESWRHNHFHGRRDIFASGEYLERVSQLDIAKHFFELGMQVNNPVTAADRGMAEEIIINLKRVENDYRIDLTREMEWVRNKVKKGESV